MIFVSLGTHEQPFNRAIDAVRPLADSHEVVVQHGHTAPRRGEPRFCWFEFLPYEDVVSLMRAAAAVVCHAGVGTIITAINADVVPVVIPRLQRFDEHIDDHQLQIVHELGSRGLLQPFLEGDDIRATIASVGGCRSPGVRRRSELRTAIAVAARVDSLREHGSGPGARDRLRRLERA